MTNFGTLMIFDCIDVNQDINNRYALDDFINEVVSCMNMKKIGNPAVEWFPDNDYNRERDLIGYSYCQIISLSSITIHCCSLSRRMYIDIFTCCKVDEIMVGRIQQIIKIIFRPRIINSKQINR